MSAEPLPLRWIGARVPKLDAPAKASGEVRYLPDFAIGGMLHGKIRRSDRVHARVKRVDTSAAKKVPGVHVVLTADEIENVTFGHGKDNTPFKGDVVRCIRDEIAAVAAETEEAAAEACRLIEIEYEDLPAIFDPRVAFEKGAPAIYPDWPDNKPFTYDYAHGDVKQGEAGSAHLVESEFDLTWVSHCCMGTSAIIAAFDTDGKLTLHSLTQVPFLYRRDLAAIVGMKPEDVRVIQPTIGGAFGSKLDIYPFEPIAVHLARAARRPVRIVFSRHEEFVASPTRQPAIVKLKSGCDARGRFTFRDAYVLLDNGGHTSWGATIPFVMMQTFSSLYRVPHVNFRTEVAYTNNPYSGSFRGYGNLQATFAIEQHVDMLAEKAGLDPLEIRRLNAQEPGEETGQGLKFVSCGLVECLDAAATQSRYAEKKAAPVAGGPRTRRGLGIASMLHVGGGAKIYRSDGCGSVLSIDDFGKVTLITGSTDIGQGSETVLAQIVAEVLGVGLDRVKVINSDTDVKPWDVGVHASRTSYVAGNSALLAAKAAKAKLLQAAAAHHQVSVDRLSLRDNFVCKDGEKLEAIDRLVRSLHFSDRAELLLTQAYFEPESVKQDKEFRGNVSPTYAFGTHVVEVEVELDTGLVRVLGVWAAHDVGRVLNALGIEGQIEGGVVMGLGYALTEQLQVEQGKVVNPAFRDYHLLTAPEVPPIWCQFIETQDPTGPFGAKGVGEAPAICVAAAIANAVYDATGVRFTRLPMTPERVLDGLVAAGLTRDLGSAPMKRLTVLSLEQALSLPYATSRMVQLGWRVIRVESPAGDPNRRIGQQLGGGPDRCAYFVGPNVGKEAITLDLTHPEGRAALHQVVQALEVDVFCCNTLPGRYQKLGIDEPTLRALRPSLLWAGISAMGPEHPEVPGYDPALQALLGIMDLTGPEDGPPMLCGLPLIDLKAGDELLTQVLAALVERNASGSGARIDVSMAQAAASWLLTVVPMLDAGARPEELTRSGSEHRHFVPSNAYPTADGFVYLAIGSDRQWASLVAIPAFASLAEPRYLKNQGRKDDRPALHQRIGALTRRRPTAEHLADFRAAGLVCAPIYPVAQAVQQPWLAARLNHTTAPDGRRIRLPPEPVGGRARSFPFPPRQGEHTLAVLHEAGLGAAELEALTDRKIALGPTEVTQR